MASQVRIPSASDSSLRNGAQAMYSAVLRSQLSFLSAQSPRLLLEVGEMACLENLYPFPPSVLWLELCEAEDNLGLISVPGRPVTCVAGTQTASVLAANSS